MIAALTGTGGFATTGIEEYDGWGGASKLEGGFFICALDEGMEDAAARLLEFGKAAEAVDARFFDLSISACRVAYLSNLGGLLSIEESGWSAGPEYEEADFAEN